MNFIFITQLIAQLSEKRTGEHFDYTFSYTKVKVRGRRTRLFVFEMQQMAGKHGGIHGVHGDAFPSFSIYCIEDRWREGVRRSSIRADASIGNIGIVRCVWVCRAIAINRNALNNADRSIWHLKRSMDPSEVEFLGEKQLVSIVPNFNSDVIYLISGSVGPFRAGLPVKVPIWLAVCLKQKQKCRIVNQEWMEIENLNERKEIEKISK